MTVNEHGQPIGEPVPGWSARPSPGPVLLKGRFVSLEPLAPSHASALYDAACGPDDDDLWTYLPATMPDAPAGMAALVDSAIADADQTFAIVPHGPSSSGRAATGRATLMRTVPEHGVTEVGWILYGRALQRTPAATEAMYLLMRHVFDNLGYRRYEWKCDSLNAPSRRAAARLGFVEEGTFRQALVYKGRNRDTTWFSITDAEWPQLRRAYDVWLDPANFDSDGRQRKSLSELRGTVA